MKKLLYNIINFYFLLFIFSLSAKNILFVVPQFPKVSDVHIINQITALIDGGHNVSIFSEIEGARGPLQEDIISYDLQKNIYYGTFPQDINQFDVIIFQLGHLAFDVKRKLGFTGKVIVCVRGYDITGYVKKHPHFYSDLYECVDLFLPVCDYFKQKLITIGCSEEKIKVLYSAVDTDIFSFSPKKLRKKYFQCISACRFVKKKGIEIFLKALRLVVDEYPYVQYLLIGNGKLKYRYKRLIQKLALDKYVVMMDWCSHKKLRKYLQAADFCIVPSCTSENGDEEGIPNIAKEAMASGTPVISTYHAGISELIVDKKTGYLVPEKNHILLAEKILSLINKAGPLLDVVIHARKCIEKKFSKKVLNKKLCNIIQLLYEQNI